MDVGGILFCPARIRCRELARASEIDGRELTESFSHLGVSGPGEPSESPSVFTGYCPVLTCAALGALSASKKQVEVVRWLRGELQPFFDRSILRYSVTELNDFLVEKWWLLEETAGVQLAWNSNGHSFFLEGNCMALVSDYVLSCYKRLSHSLSVGDACVCSSLSGYSPGRSGCSSSVVLSAVEDLLCAGRAEDTVQHPVVLDSQQFSESDRVLLFAVVSLTGFLVLMKAIRMDEQSVCATWLVLHHVLSDPPPPYTQ